MPLTLYKRGEIWHFRGTVAGRRLRGSTGTADKDTAAQVAANVEARQWKCSVAGPEAVMTFAQASLLYRAGKKHPRFLPKIEDYWQDTLVKDITAGAIRQSAIVLYPNASGATRNRQVIVPTQAVINHAAESDLCQKISVKRFPVDRKIKTPATWEWVQAFKARAAPGMGAMALFMFLTGARRSEAVRLRWGDIDLHNRTARIRDTKTRNERIAHLPDPLFLALANLPRNDGPVFGVAISTADKLWRETTAKAGIEPLTTHCCRHGFATAMLRAGIDVVTVAKLGGWKSPQHVFETYGHADNDLTLTDRLIDTLQTQPSAPNAKRKVVS